MTYSNTLRTIRLLLAFTLAPTQLTPRECAAQPQKEQTTFCETGAPAEDELKPVPLPTEVLTAVMNSELGKQAQADAKERHLELDPTKLLKGAPIQLSNTRSRSFILIGDAPPLPGVDNTWFWIVGLSGGRATTLLRMGANCVELLPTKTLGYRDISAHWSSAAGASVKTHKFDGESYKLRRSTWRERKPSDGK
jgi:hypothetical protein